MNYKNKLKLLLITILLVQNTSCIIERSDLSLFLSKQDSEFSYFKFSLPSVSQDLRDMENFLRLEKYTEADKLEKKLLSLNLSNNEKSKLFYRLASLNKPINEKEKYYKKALELAFWGYEKAFIYDQLGRFYNYDKKDFIEAEKHYKKAIELDRNIAYISRLAYFYYNLNRDKEGNELLKNAINTTFSINDKVKLSEVLLRHYNQKKDFNSIEKNSIELLVIDSKNSSAILSLSSLYFQQKKYFEVEKMLKYGLSLNDYEKESYYFGLVRLYKEQNRLLDLEKTYIDIKNDFKSTQYYYFLEELYYTQKRYIDLEKLYKEKLSKKYLKDKEKLSTYTSLALLNIIKKDLNTANTYFENALTFFGSNYTVSEKVNFMRNYLTFQKLIGVNEDKFIKTKNDLIKKHLSYSPKYSEYNEVERLKLEFDNLDFYKFNSLNQEIRRYNDVLDLATMSYTLSLSLNEAKKDSPKLEDIAPTYEPIKK